MKEYIGQLQGKGLRVGIVASRFNELVTRSLVSGAMDGLTRHGVDHEDITLVWVPGAFDIPLLAKKMADAKKYDAIICLGAVIRGATAHFDYVAGQAASGIAKASLDSEVPVVFEVLTTDTLEQALERAGSKAGNKGFDGALVAIELANLLQSMENSDPSRLSCCVDKKQNVKTNH